MAGVRHSLRGADRHPRHSSIRIFLETDVELIAGLNTYSHQPAAFDGQSEAVAHILATNGALAVGKAAAQAKARNVMRALETSREIGMARALSWLRKGDPRVGVRPLRIASQRSRRKLAGVAVVVTEDAVLPKGAGVRGANWSSRNRRRRETKVGASLMSVHGNSVCRLLRHAWEVGWGDPDVGADDFASDCHGVA